MSLAELEARVAHDLACLNWGEADWLAPQSDTHDVVIIGGGQSGLGAAFAIMRERIGNVLILDENPSGYEGPWDSYARMATLRTPKHLTSIDLGVGSLTPRAWWEAQHGAESWAELGKIPRLEWMAYLRWYRRVLGLPVRNDARVTLIEPLGGRFRLHLGDGTSLLARKVVLATGIQGGGHWHIPPMIAEALPRHRYAHTSEAIDFASLAGKRVAILGGGASAFDNASTALEAGAARVEVHMRRSEMPRVNPIRFMEGAGMIQRYPALDDAGKYDVMKSFFGRAMPPTTDMFERAAAFPGFALRLGSPWLDVVETPEGVRVSTPRGSFTCDQLILSTGLVTDPALRPELALVQGRIARWGDRFTPPPGSADPVIDTHPYLGPGFQLLPHKPEDADALHGLFAFNYAAVVSLGLSASAISGLRHALPRLATGVADQLFLDERETIVAAYHAYAVPEFTAEWRDETPGETGEAA
ncbi:NAD(P)/FAD-dependent oxidoreductase [Sphingomonas sp.]|uniref:NAD(P)-binding domain-containing protein n=1 Tax=Sphingomonas sp. TaxID=28214 RepID=UPI001B05C26A|nr:NAD(P)/FAD-dependent oxidoreductase [Sphingomonas sp.]MBO9713227.1 NAD(P)/FAD-dependent oxidoreductase [Sphingomonas sp.]